MKNGSHWTLMKNKIAKWLEPRIVPGRVCNPVSTPRRYTLRLTSGSLTKSLADEVSVMIPILEALIDEPGVRLLYIVG
jgi:hypothetical protein